MQHNILRLDVPVNDTQRMNLVHSVADLFHQECHFCLRELLGLFQEMVQLSSCTHFQNYVNVLVVIEVTVQFDDVGVVQKHLDLQFADELLGDLLLYQQALLDHFQCTNKTCPLFSHKVHSAILAVSQLFHLLKILGAYLFAAVR